MFKNYAELIHAKQVNPQRLLESGKFDCEDELRLMDCDRSTWLPVEDVTLDADGFMNVSCSALSKDYAISVWDHSSAIRAFR